MIFKLSGLGVHIGVRDLRIDFFRGLALYMVVFDHIGGDPLSRFTYQGLGFSDAAEIFVYVSGVACGLAYSSSRTERLGCVEARARSARYPDLLLLCSVQRGNDPPHHSRSRHLGKPIPYR